MARKSRKNRNTENTVNNKNKPQKQKVGAYVRLSSGERNGTQNDSIENQQAIIENYIKTHKDQDFELIETYIDSGKSGQSFARPAFNRLLFDIKNKKINCCITKDLSRLGRNAIDAGYYIEKFFPANNIRFIAITDKYDSADPNSSSIMLSLKNMLNEAYALDIAKKVKQAKRLNAQKGLFNGPRPPFGYLKDPNNKHKLIPNPKTAPIVKNIFMMAASGEPISKIIEYLEGKNIKLHKNTIYRILKHPVYCGDMQQSGIIIKNTHKALVSRKIFAYVNKTSSRR